MSRRRVGVVAAAIVLVVAGVTWKLAPRGAGDMAFASSGSSLNGSVDSPGQDAAARSGVALRPGIDVLAERTPPLGVATRPAQAGRPGPGKPGSTTRRTEAVQIPGARSTAFRTRTAKRRAKPARAEPATTHGRAQFDAFVRGARAAFHARKPRRCLRLLDQAAKIRPEPGAVTAQLDLERAKCSMLAGKCKLGADLLRRSLRYFATGTAGQIAQAVQHSVEQWCPMSALPTKASQIRVLSVRARRATMPECRRLAGYADRLSINAPRESLRNHVRPAYRWLATCFARAGDCVGARRLKRKELQLEAALLRPPTITPGAVAKQAARAVARLSGCRAGN